MTSPNHFKPSSPNGESTNGAGSLNGMMYDDPGSSSQWLHELLQTMWTGKWVILAVTVLFVAGATWYTKSQTTQYRTSTLLVIDQEASSMTSQLGSSRGMGPSALYGQNRTIQNELFVLENSRSIAERVARQLIELENHPETNAPIQVIRRGDGGLRSEADVARRVQWKTRASAAAQEVDAVRIMTTTTAPWEASLIANLYAEAYITRTREKSRESLQASRSFLEEQAEKMRGEVQTAESELEAYMTREKAVALDQEASRVVTEISDLSARRSELQIELDMLQASYDTKREQLEDIEPRITEQLSSSAYRELTRVQEEKARVEGLIASIRQSNPDMEEMTPALRENVREKREQARALQEQADSLAQHYVNETLAAGGAAGSGDTPGGVEYVAQQRRTLAEQRIRISGLEAQVASVNDKLEDAQAKLRRIPQQSIELAQLQRERRTKESVYNLLMQRLQEARIAEASEIGYAEVIQPAGPGSPIPTGLNRNIFLAFVLGFLGSSGLVILFDRLDTKVRQPDDVRSLGLQTIGVVPDMHHLIDSEFNGEKTVTVENNKLSTSLTMLLSPMSAVAEAYRRIRTNLQFARPDKTIRSLTITSSEKGEGKSTTSTNLALAFATAGKKTLLVDADLRRPRVHDLLDLDREPGLTHFLYDDDIDIDVFQTEIENFWVLPAGETVPNPAELLSSERMRDLIHHLRDEFDYVIFDTPPVLLFSDALGLAPQCDATLLVASANKTDSRALTHASGLLTDVEADMIGTILNRYRVSTFGPSYGYNYGYAQSYKQLSDYYDVRSSEPSAAGRLRSWLS